MPEPGDSSPHHRHLEQSRAQVIELLSRQAVEKGLVSRSESRKQDVVAQLVARQHQAALEQRLAQFHPADTAFVLEALAPDARAMAWSLVRAERRGAVLLETADAVRRSLVAGMAPDEVAALVAPLSSDDIADLVSSLPDESRADVLARLDGAGQEQVRSMLSFPEGSIGAMMDLDFVAVRDDASLEAVQRLLRRRQKLPPHTNQLFVVDREHRLKGLLGISQLVMGDPQSTVAALMRTDPVYFYTDERGREAIAAFEKYELISAPVLNLHRQVVGRVTVDAVLDAVHQRAQSESLRQVGLSEEDEDLYAPVLNAARRRWPWLAINLATALLASRVIDAFEGTIATLVALATLMPIVASIGGNSGNQSVALVIRGLALNQLGPVQLRQVLRRELAISALNGAVWGAALGLVTLLLHQSPALSLVIAAALLLNLVVASAVGVLAPVFLQRFGRDPAMGSSIILTATTDSMGFLIFLGLASALLV